MLLLLIAEDPLTIRFLYGFAIVTNDFYHQTLSNPFTVRWGSSHAGFLPHDGES
jgi:hypothetical protein